MIRQKEESAVSTTGSWHYHWHYMPTRISLGIYVNQFSQVQIHLQVRMKDNIHPLYTGNPLNWKPLNKYFCKQWRSRWNAACCISSRSALYAAFHQGLHCTLHFIWVGTVCCISSRYALYAAFISVCTVCCISSGSALYAAFHQGLHCMLYIIWVCTVCCISSGSSLYAAFRLGLHYIAWLKQNSWTEVHHHLENSTRDPLKYPSGRPIPIVSICMGKSIRIQRVKIDYMPVHDKINNCISLKNSRSLLWNQELQCALNA